MTKLVSVMDIEVIHFFLGTLEEVNHLGPNDSPEKTYFQNKIEISGFNEAIQNAKTSIVMFWRIHKIFFTFHPIMVGIIG